MAKVSCVMEAMLYGPGVESSSKNVAIIDTHPNGFSVLIKYASEGSLQEKVDLWDTPINALPYLLSVTNMYQVERLKLHCASKMWNMASEETVTSFLWWAIQANCTQL
jgi:speckle-type POZ protein